MTRAERSDTLTLLFEYAEAILVAIVFALFAKAFVFEAFQIPSASMERGLLVGDHVVVNKFVYGPHHGPWSALLPYRDVGAGDVFVFRYPVDPRRDFVKRAVGTAGDLLEMRDGALFRNGSAVPEPYLSAAAAASRGGDFAPLTVPPESVFAMGDNRGNSQDSRVWGPVPLSHVRGRALLVYWSYELGASSRFEGRGAGLRRTLDTAIHFFSRTRWERTGRIVR